MLLTAVDTFFAIPEPESSVNDNMNFKLGWS